MRKLFAAMAVFAICSFSASAQSITPDEAAKHVGDTVTVCGKIFGGRHFEGKRTLLNMGAAFPKSPLTIVVDEVNLKNFSSAPEEMYKDKEVCIKGLVKEYNGKPQIFIIKEEDVVMKK